jgi:undecaprenyl diphosphate synthase
VVKGKPKLTLPQNTKVPDHLAIIPDGNRRWARARGLHTFKGHKAGFDNAVELCRQAREWGVHTVTLWGFSTENWDRTPAEVAYLMRLYRKLIDDYLKEAHESKVRIYHLGRRDRLPKILMKKIDQAMEETKKYDKYIMNIALDYGGRDEILRIVSKLLSLKVTNDQLTESLLDSYSDLKNQPYPNVDLMIRTSGEQRTSGFLMWHANYNEFYFTDMHFPDFTPDKLREAILDYSLRRRRFGGNDAEAHLTFSPSVSARLELDWWRLRNVPDNTRFRDFVKAYLKEQYGLSKDLTKDSAEHLLRALAHGHQKDWQEAKKSLKAFYTLIKNHLKLAFEPELVANLKVDLWKEAGNGAGEAMETLATNLTAEEYRISHFQASKAGHLRVLAEREMKKAEGGNKASWTLAYEYLHRYYQALKERVA